MTLPRDDEATVALMAAIIAGALLHRMPMSDHLDTAKKLMTGVTIGAVDLARAILAEVRRSSPAPEREP